MSDTRTGDYAPGLLQRLAAAESRVRELEAQAGAVAEVVELAREADADPQNWPHWWGRLTFALARLDGKGGSNGKA